MRVPLFILGVAGLLWSGCDPVARETITVRLGGTNDASVATNALALIARVLANDDFNPSKLAPEVRSNTPSLVAAYGDAVELHLGCAVYHQPGEIQIEFNQLGRYHLAPQGIRARDNLRKALSEAFGNEAVAP